MQLSAQCSFHKVNFDNSCDKTLKFRYYQLFSVSSKYRTCKYLETRFLKDFLKVSCKNILQRISRYQQGKCIKGVKKVNIEYNKDIKTEDSKGIKTFS